MLKPTQNQQQIYSVSKLNRLARRILEGEIGNIWLSAEISNFTAASSGHWYFTLKDPKAQIKAAMFRGANSRFKYRPKEGDKVLARANISLYEARGDYQLIVEHIELDGDGALKAEFEAIKLKLFNQGLFDASNKRPLPKKIARVGVVTSATGAALHDILTVLKRRNPAIEVIVYPSQVQGDTAASQIIQAINVANQRCEVDVLLIGRGGGSIEDLWCFNDEALALVIAHSTIPTVSAVGHEVDVTIADFVADLRAPTPSAAAELVSGDLQQQNIRIQNLLRALQQSLKQLLQQTDHRVLNLFNRLLRNHPETQLNQQAQRLDSLQARMQACMFRNIQQPAQMLAFKQRRLAAATPLSSVLRNDTALRKLNGRLTHTMERYLVSRNTQVQKHAQLLNSVSPLATLARGYSITSHQGDILQSTEQVAEGDEIVTRLKTGQVHSVVQKIEP